MSIVTTADPNMPDLSPRGLENDPGFLAQIDRVRRMLYASGPGLVGGEDWTWVALFGDGSVLAEADGVLWGMQIQIPMLDRAVVAMCLVRTIRPTLSVFGGVPTGYRAFFTRRRSGPIGGKMNTLCTIVGAEPVGDTPGNPGYLFIDHLGQTVASTDLNAV